MSKLFDFGGCLLLLLKKFRDLDCTACRPRTWRFTPLVTTRDVVTSNGRPQPETTSQKKMKRTTSGKVTEGDDS
jgi:hypothetical protein